MKLFSFVAAILSLGMCATAVAQEVPAEGPKAPILDVSAPAHLGSEAPPLAMDSDVQSRNVMVLGFSVGGAYDTRGLYDSTTNTFSGSARYFVQPSIAFQRTTNQGAWTLSYTPGFGYSPDDSNSNQYTHNVAGDVVWKPNGRLQLHLRQDYSRTTNPFETVGRVDLLPGLGGALGPNYTGVVPATRRDAIVSNMDVSYAIAEHTAFGFTGGFQKSDYTSTQASTAAFNYENSEVFTGSVFLSHQFSEIMSAGLQFAYSDLYSMGQDASRIQTPTPMMFVRLMPNTHVQFTFYGGAQFARAHETYDIGTLVFKIPVQEHWYPTFGGSLAFSRRMQAFDITADQRVSNGGGVLAAVKSLNLGAGYRVRVAPLLLLEARVNYGNEKAIGVFNKGDYFRSVWVGGGPTIQMSRSWSLRGEVAYVHQEEFGLSPVAGNHMIVQGSLDYRFKKNLGE